MRVRSLRCASPRVATVLHDENGVRRIRLPTPLPVALSTIHREPIARPSPATMRAEAEWARIAPLVTPRVRDRWLLRQILFVTAILAIAAGLGSWIALN